MMKVELEAQAKFTSLLSSAIYNWGQTGASLTAYSAAMEITCACSLQGTP